MAEKADAQRNGWQGNVFSGMRVLEFTAVIIAVVAFFFDLEARKEERAARVDERVARAEERTARAEERRVQAEERKARAEERLARMWDLATDPRPGNSGKIPAVQFLNNLNQPLNGISIPNAYLAGVKLKGVDFRNAKLAGVDFTGADLREANFSSADLRGASFWGADLGGANFYKADISGSEFLVANLKGAKITDAKAIKTNFSGGEVINTDFTSSDLNKAVFYGANLSGAKFKKANLGEAVIEVPELARFFFNIAGKIDLGKVFASKSNKNFKSSLEKQTPEMVSRLYKSFGRANNLTQEQIAESCVKKGQKQPELSNKLKVSNTKCFEKKK